MTPTDPSDISRSRLLRDRILFYAGMLFAIVGGPVMALGSLAHDRYAIPILGEAYDAFGWLNVTFLLVGIVILLVGMGLIALSLRGGILPSRSDAGGLQ